MKSSKSAIRRKTHALPTLRFEDQQLTSFSGLVIFQRLFEHLQLKKRLRGCFRHPDFVHFEHSRPLNPPEYGGSL